MHHYFILLFYHINLGYINLSIINKIVMVYIQYIFKRILKNNFSFFAQSKSMLVGEKRIVKTSIFTRIKT